MANQTVYPYGTGGELPSSIGIINDLTTGGVNKALSAEMGKTLNGNLTQLGQEVEDIGNVINGVVPIEETITPSGWSTGAMNKNTGYQATGATAFKTSAYTSINAYVLKENPTLVITMPVSTTSGHGEYGIALYSRQSASGYLTGVGIRIGEENGVETIEIPFPAGAKLFRTTFWAVDTYGTFSCKVRYLEQGESHEERINTLETTTDELSKVVYNLPKTKNYVAVESGGIDATSGQDVASNEKVRTDFMPTSFLQYNLYGQMYLAYYNRQPVSPNLVVYYDENKDYLGYTQNNIIDNGHSIEEVAYIRLVFFGTDTSAVIACVGNVWYSSNEENIGAFTDSFTEARGLPVSQHMGTIETLDAVVVPVPQYSGLSNPYVIRIATQTQLGDIKNAINAAITNGEKNILVYFTASTLSYGSGNINLIASQYPNASDVNIEFRSTKDCIIKPSGYAYVSNNSTPVKDGKFVFGHSAAFDYQKMYFNGDKEIPLFSNVRQFAAIAIETGNTNADGRKEYKIELPKDDTTVFHSELMIQIFHNYRGKFFPVHNIADGYVYFYDIYGVDRNIAVSITNKVVLFYRWCNSMDGEVYISSGEIHFDVKYSQVTEARQFRFIDIGDAFKSVIISGMNVHFSTDYEVEQYGSYSKTEGALIRIQGFNPSNDSSRFIKIADNNFFNIRNIIVSADDSSNNIVYSHNIAENCYKDECRIGNNNGGYIIGNVSKNGNRYLDHYSIFHCASKQSGLVSDNIVTDFAYCAIRSGGGTDQTAANVIIERNIVEYSDDYADNAFHMGDCGAIYAYREASQLIVRDNIVSNYRGHSYAVPIYMDGYISNAKVYRNLVINSASKYESGTSSFYDISFAASDSDSLTYTGKNRFCGMNILTGRVFMANRDTDTGSILAMNIEVHTDKVNWLPDRYGSTIATFEEPFHIFNAAIYSDRVSLPMAYYFTQWRSVWGFNWKTMSRVLFNKN